MADYKVLGDILAAHAATRPDAVALAFEGRETTYDGFAKRCNQVGRALIASGCGKGTRVAQIGRNSDVFYEMLFGAGLVGSVLVAVNWRLAPPEIAGSSSKFSSMRDCAVSSPRRSPTNSQF